MPSVDTSTRGGYPDMNLRSAAGREFGNGAFGLVNGRRAPPRAVPGRTGGLGMKRDSHAHHGSFAWVGHDGEIPVHQSDSLLHAQQAEATVVPRGSVLGRRAER